MRHKKLILLISIWIIIVLLDYYLLPYFIQPIIWIFTVIVLLVFIIKQIIKTSKEYPEDLKIRIVILLTLGILFTLTFYNFNKIPRKIIEKVDWMVLYNKRNKIVDDVKSGKLKPNTGLNNGICKLPFNFPIVSNGGNDIWLFQNNNNNNNNNKTIKFWISRGFFDSPQSYFIYTNDPETINSINRLITKYPENNYKIKENWYRVLEMF